MFKIIKKEIEWGGRPLTLETGRVARQADGAVIVTYGETSVLCTVVMRKEAVEGTDYFPLNVHYKEGFSAAGKIPGGFFKREGRPLDKETVTCRLIDRPIRPLFPAGFYNEVQIICSVLSYDGQNNPDIVALIGASAALSISGAPFLGPIAAARIGIIDDKLVLNPDVKVMDSDASLDLIVSGTADSIMMVESEASELSEEKILEAVSYAHESFQPVIKLLNEFKKKVNKPEFKFEPVTFDDDLIKQVKKIADKELVTIFKMKSKQDRVDNIYALRKKLGEEIDAEKYAKESISSVFKSLQERLLRDSTLKGKRIDGRDTKTIRPIETEVSIMPRTHGSALFTRGETQALVVTTLGGPTDEQIIDSIDADYKERFMLHYNFPPYSVGEASFMRGPGRREIGHGKLAWKAIRPLLPTKEAFPYTIRVVADITESNGSSSMATVCGTTLSLMDAGVPLKAPVAGIAMGLIKEKDKYVILTDILGDEDNLGDMDFKVAGTEQGVTALQMDIKIPGITAKIMEDALAQAKEGRLFILGKLSEMLSLPREAVSKYAPSFVKVSINKEKIGALIGPGGKVIKEICEKTGAKLEVSDDGTVSIVAATKEASSAAQAMVAAVAFDPELGQIYDAEVKQLLDFGAVVSFMGKEGLVHISEVADERVKGIRDVLGVGQKLKVKLIEIDPHRGKIRLSIKAAGPNEEIAKRIKESKEQELPPEEKAPGNEPGPPLADLGEEEDEVNYNREDYTPSSSPRRKPFHKTGGAGPRHRSGDRGSRDSRGPSSGPSSGPGGRRFFKRDSNRPDAGGPPRKKFFNM